MTDLAYLPATDALRLFRSRELSPVELLEAVIARAEETEPEINAFTETRFDEAIEQARAAEARYAKGEPRALEGLPVALKEKVDVEGWTAQYGSLAYEDNVADHTEPVAERIFEAGGIVHARTTTPEFSVADFTHSRLWGITRNPWNLEWAVGGSSGGAGAALAAGTATLASGSDIGGSIRTPSTFCGTVGFKPPYGRVPSDPPSNLDAYRADGPMARTVVDTAVFLNAICGPHPRDVVSMPAIELPTEYEGGASGLRAAFFTRIGDFTADPDVERETREAVSALGDAGAQVEEVSLPWDPNEVWLAAGIHWASIWVEREMGGLDDKRDLLCDYTIGFIDDSRKILEEHTFQEGLELEAKTWEPLGELFTRFDVVVCPGAAKQGYPAGATYGEGVEETDGLMVVPFNIAGRCPVLAVPSGMADNGIPAGVQIAGRPYDDETVFRAGAALEHARPWAGRRPAIG